MDENLDHPYDTAKVIDLLEPIIAAAVSGDREKTDDALASIRVKLPQIIEHIIKITCSLGEIMNKVKSASESGDSENLKEMLILARDRVTQFEEATGQQLGIRTSITQLELVIQRREAELMQSRRMATLGVMASGVAHEINQPLQIILGVAQNSIREIRQNGIDNDGIIRDLAQIAANTKRIDKIVNHLLVLARDRKPKLEMVNVNTVIDNSFIMFHQQLTKARGIEIIQNLSPDLPPIKADAIQLEQVFINLINNARDALEGRKNKTIEVSTQNQNGNIQVRFRDNGKGVSPEDLLKIFDVFFTTKEEGMGVGLYIARDIIQSYDGTITAQSKIDEGTTFLIELPVAVKEDAK